MTAALYLRERQNAGYELVDKLSNKMLGKSDKEVIVRQIRAIERETGLDIMPSYNGRSR